MMSILQVYNHNHYFLLTEKERQAEMFKITFHLSPQPPSKGASGRGKSSVLQVVAHLVGNNLHYFFLPSPWGRGGVQLVHFI